MSGSLPTSGVRIPDTPIPMHTDSDGAMLALLWHGASRMSFPSKDHQLTLAWLAESAATTTDRVSGHAVGNEPFCAQFRPC
jgi:hypothetical protein